MAFLEAKQARSLKSIGMRIKNELRLAESEVAQFLPRITNRYDVTRAAMSLFAPVGAAMMYFSSAEQAHAQGGGPPVCYRVEPIVGCTGPWPLGQTNAWGYGSEVCESDGWHDKKSGSFIEPSSSCNDDISTAIAAPSPAQQTSTPLLPAAIQEVPQPTQTRATRKPTATVRSSGTIKISSPSPIPTSLLLPTLTPYPTLPSQPPQNWKPTDTPRSSSGDTAWIIGTVVVIFVAIAGGVVAHNAIKPFR